MKNKYLNILFLFAICCFSYQNVNAQCTAAIAGPYVDYNNTFGGAPCDDAGGACPVNELTAFEVYAEEGYLIDNVMAGVTYTVSICNSAAGAGMGAQAWPAEFTVNAPSGAIDAFGLDGGSSCELTFTATESGTYIIAIYETGACGTSANTGAGADNGYLSMTCAGTAPPCAPPQCSANYDGPTSDCDGDVVFGAGCSLDNDFVTAGNVAQFEIFYETDGTGGAGILDAVSGYSTGADILANLNSGAAGEVVFFGNPGDCTELTSIFANFSCAPFTLDVYVSTLEYNDTGDPVAINTDCPVETVTLVFNPEQGGITILETPGDCDNLATAIVGFDNGDGAGGDPDGDLDDAEDFICGTYESAPAIAYPCGTGADNVSTVAPLAAADLATLLGDADPACYTDITFTAAATCPSAACPACDAVAPTLAANAPECPDGTTVTLGVTGGSTNAGEITEYIITDPATGLISAVTPDATGNVAALAVGEEICITAITHVQSELDQIVNDLDACTGGIVIAALGLSTSGNTLQAVYEGVDNSPLVGPATLTIDDVLALIGGTPGGTGPGLGGLADLSVLSPGLMCPILPFCFNLSATVCATGVEAPTCMMCEDPCANNTGADGACTYDPDYDVCDDGCADTADSYNYTTCECEFVLTEPDCDDGCPDTADSYDAAACACVNTLTEPDCDDGCADTADSYDAAACACVNTLTEPNCDDGDPTTIDSYDVANCQCVNEGTCVDPCATNTGAAEACTYAPDYDVCDDGCANTADSYNYTTCECEFVLTEPNCDDGCPDTADSYDAAACACVNTLTEPNCDDGCPDTADSYDAAACACVNTLTEPDCDDGNPDTADSYDAANCTCVNETTIVMGCTDPCSSNYNAMANQDDGSCDPRPDCDDGCADTADSYNETTCACENVLTEPDCDDGNPDTADSYDAANCTCVNESTIVMGCTDPCSSNYNAMANQDDGSCDPRPDCDDGCADTADSYNEATCACENVLTEPDCDDGDPSTADSYDAAACACVNTASDVSVGISDPCNCFAGLDLDGDGENEFARDVITITPGVAPYSVSNYSGGLFDANGNALSAADLDALIAAAVAAGGNIGITVYLPADGSSTYTVEVTDANGSSASITGGGCSPCGDNAIPTMGEWGLIILALLLLNLGVLYIRQTEMKIVSE